MEVLFFEAMQQTDELWQKHFPGTDYLTRYYDLSNQHVVRTILVGIYLCILLIRISQQRQRAVFEIASACSAAALHESPYIDALGVMEFNEGHAYLRSLLATGELDSWKARLRETFSRA